MIMISEPHWSAPPPHFGTGMVLTLQLPAANAPRAATTPKARANLLSIEWQACFSKTWAWWKIQNSRTKERNSVYCQSRVISSHDDPVWLSLNSQRKAALLIVAVKREFSGTYVPLVLRSNICSVSDNVTTWFQLKIRKTNKQQQLSSHLIVGTKQHPVDWFSDAQKFFPSLTTNKSGWRWEFFKSR